MRYYNSMSRLREALTQRILVLDGAMGTMIQAAGLSAQDFGGAQYALSHFGLDTKVTVYTGLIALIVNLIVTFVVTVFVRGKVLPDQTEPGDFELEAGDPGVEPLELDSEEAATTTAPAGSR